MKLVRINIKHLHHELPFVTTRLVDDRQEVNLVFVHVAAEQYLRERMRQDIYISRQNDAPRGFEGYIYRWDLAQEKQDVVEGKLFVSFEVEVQPEPFIPSMEESLRLLEGLKPRIN